MCYVCVALGIGGCGGCERGRGVVSGLLCI